MIFVQQSSSNTQFVKFIISRHDKIYKEFNDLSRFDIFLQ